MRMHLDVSAFDGTRHYAPGVHDVPNLEFAARLVARGHGAVLVQPDGADTPVEASDEETLKALQIAAPSDAARRVRIGRARRLAERGRPPRP